MDAIQIIFVIIMVIILAGAGVFAWITDNGGRKNKTDKDDNKTS